MLLYEQKKYQEALQVWVQALALDQRLGRPIHQPTVRHITALVGECHLEKDYATLKEQYSLL